MPTHEWTLAQDPHGRGGRRRSKKAVITAAVIAGVVALVVVLGLLDLAPPGEAAPGLGGRSYNAHVECEVNTVGSAGTVTINGTIKGDSARYKVTVEVLDAASKQRIGARTFDVRDTTTFGGTTAARASIGPAGIECRITEVS